MDEEKIFATSDVTRTNLYAVAREQSRLHEALICEMSFIAKKIAMSVTEAAKDGMSLNEIISLLAEEISFEPQNPPSDTPDFMQRDVRAFLRQQNGINKAVFASQLIEALSDNGISVSEADYLDTEGQSETFAYVKNSLSDEAFDVFSQEFSDPRVFYAQSFREACLDVLEGKVGYCILPFEEKGGSRIPGISALVSSLDLKIVAITPVFGLEGNADMKYALISRSFIIPESDDKTDRYFEINVGYGSGLSLGELMCAAEYFSISVFRAYTRVTDEDGTDVSFTLILKDGGTTFAPLLTYLGLFASEYEPIGIYKNIE